MGLIIREQEDWETERSHLLSEHSNVGSGQTPANVGSHRGTEYAGSSREHSVRSQVEPSRDGDPDDIGGDFPGDVRTASSSRTEHHPSARYPPGERHDDASQVDDGEDAVQVARQPPHGDVGEDVHDGARRHLQFDASSPIINTIGQVVFFSFLFFTLVFFFF